MSTGELNILSGEEAIHKMRSGEKLERCHISNLNLDNQEIDFAINISNSQIDMFTAVGATFKAAIYFTDITFNSTFAWGWGRASTKTPSSKFLAEVIMKKCLFKSKALFGGSSYETIFSCQDNIFYEDTIFRGVHFKQQAYFWGSKFHTRVFFDSAKFDLEGHFDKCHFGDNASFERVCFAGQDASFNNITSDGEMNFQDAKVECFFAFRKASVNGEISFSNTKFHQEVDFLHSEFKNRALFNEVCFENTTNFSYAQFERSVSFLNVSFQEVKFLNTEFYSEAIFNLDAHTRKSLAEESQNKTVPTPTRFHQVADFTNARFHKRAIFEEVCFTGKAFFANCFFGEQANFVAIQAENTISFESSYCNQEFSAVNAQFEYITFDYANINRRLDLSHAKMKQISFYKAAVDLIVVERSQIRAKLFYENPENPMFDRSSQEYLLLKESFGQRGLHDEEDWAYYKFRQAKRKSRTKNYFRKLKEGSFLQKFSTLFKLTSCFFERIIIDRATGYGTRPLNITLVAISFIMFFAAVYNYFPNELVRPENMPFGFSQSVYFSFATFTTMGFGDIQPRLDSMMQFVVSFEAFFGLFIMTLFVGTYTRKIIR